VIYALWVAIPGQIIIRPEDGCPQIKSRFSVNFDFLFIEIWYHSCHPDFSVGRRLIALRLLQLNDNKNERDLSFYNLIVFEY
jgi:hypothetical protein